MMYEKQGFEPCKHIKNNYNTGELNPMDPFAQIFNMGITWIQWLQLLTRWTLSIFNRFYDI